MRLEVNKLEIFPVQLRQQGPSGNLSGLIFRHLMTFQGPETHLDRQGVLKNVVLGTKNINSKPTWPKLALRMSNLPYFLTKTKG